VVGRSGCHRLGRGSPRLIRQHPGRSRTPRQPRRTYSLTSAFAASEARIAAVPPASACRFWTSPTGHFWAPQGSQVNAFHHMVYAVATGLAFELLSNAPGARSSISGAHQGELRSLSSPGGFAVAARRTLVRRVSHPATSAQPAYECRSERPCRNRGSAAACAHRLTLQCRA